MNHQTPISQSTRPIQVALTVTPTPKPPRITLTRREKEALQWSIKGKSSWEISRIFDCTEAGVNYHFSNIRRKFGVSSRWVAARMALELGLI